MTKQAIILFCLTILCLINGCEDDDDFDHVPAPGNGAIIVDNHLYNDLELFVDGEPKGRINDDDDRAFDMEPGVYRVVLSERHASRSYRDDIDVLGNRLTILRVRSEYDEYGELYVTVEID